MEPDQAAPESTLFMFVDKASKAFQQTIFFL